MKFIIKYNVNMWDRWHRNILVTVTTHLWIQLNKINTYKKKTERRKEMQRTPNHTTPQMYTNNVNGKKEQITKRDNYATNITICNYKFRYIILPVPSSFGMESTNYN